MKIVCVCTGNTCRSPMAAALLSRLLPGAEVTSAGLYAEDGAPPSYHALLAMDELGVDISGHMARRFRPEMGEGALLLAMTRSHARACVPFAQTPKWNSFLGDEEVPDPFGRGMEAYERTARILEEGAQAIARRLQGA